MNPSPAVQTYTGTIPLTQNVAVRARLLTTGGQWSALVQESFTVTPRPGDYDRDGSVTAADGVFWANAFGASTGTGTGLQADGNGDGVVDAADFTVWRDNYTPPPASVSIASFAVSGAVSALASSTPTSRAPRVSGGSLAPLRFLKGTAQTQELILARGSVRGAGGGSRFGRYTQSRSTQGGESLRREGDARRLGRRGASCRVTQLALVRDLLHFDLLGRGDQRGVRNSYAGRAGGFAR